MQWSFKIGSICGIPIRVHATFLLLFLIRGQTATDIALTVAVFGCVILHELGHSLVARRYGIPVDNITLLPIGGVAAMKGLPRNALAEFLMAIAGPAVSVALAALLALAAGSVYGAQAWHLPPDGPSRLGFLSELAVINFFLAGFNLIPAFPMDGGRVLRSILWSRKGFYKATAIAAKIGKGLAILCVLAVLLSPYLRDTRTPGDFWLVVIAFFIYSGANAEARTAEWIRAVSTLTVSKAMQTDFKTLRPETTIEQTALLSSHTDQDLFPILDQNRPVGLLTTQALVRAMQDRHFDRPVADFMTKELICCRPLDMLASIVQAIDKRNLPGILVMDEDRLVGLISSRNLTVRPNE